jgi:hypothetical protein
MNKEQKANVDKSKSVLMECIPFSVCIDGSDIPSKVVGFAGGETLQLLFEFGGVHYESAATVYEQMISCSNSSKASAYAMAEIKYVGTDGQEHRLCELVGTHHVLGHSCISSDTVFPAV